MVYTDTTIDAAPVLVHLRAACKSACERHALLHIVDCIHMHNGQKVSHTERFPLNATKDFKVPFRNHVGPREHVLLASWPHRHPPCRSTHQIRFRAMSGVERLFLLAAAGGCRRQGRAPAAALHRQAACMSSRAHAQFVSVHVVRVRVCVSVRACMRLCMQASKLGSVIA